MMTMRSNFSTFFSRQSIYNYNTKKFLAPCSKLLFLNYFFFKEILRISLFRHWSSNIHGFCFIKFSKVVKVSNISRAKNRISGTHG